MQSYGAAVPTNFAVDQIELHENERVRMPIRLKVLAGLTAAILATTLLLFSAAAASAAPGDSTSPYPVPTSGPTITIDGGAGFVAGGSYRLDINNFQPGETVGVVLFSAPYQLGTFVTDASGHASTTVTLPTDLPDGSHTVVATGDKGSTASFGFTLSVASDAVPSGTGGGGGGGGLAFTGVAVGASLILALGLLTAGTMTLLAGRRRASN
jgi:hypothetical protein